MVDGSIASDVQVDQSVEICEFLSHCEIFAKTTPAALAEIAQNMRVESFPKGEVIIRQGDEGDKFYIIKEGEAIVFTRETGKDPVSTLKTGEFFGEIALLKDVPRSATVTAAQDTQTYVLSKPDFLAATDKSDPFKKQLLDFFFRRQ